MSPPDEELGPDYSLSEITAMLPVDVDSVSEELRKAGMEDETGVWRYAFRFYMRTKREERGLSIRQAAKDSGISEGRWRQLESGYQMIRGDKIPVKTTEETVLRIAAAMRMDPNVALTSAGIKSRFGFQTEAWIRLPDEHADDVEADELDMPDLPLKIRRGLAALIPTESPWTPLDPENLTPDILARLPMLSIAALDRVAHEALAIRRAKAVEILRTYDLTDPMSLMYLRTGLRRSASRVGLRLQEYDRQYRRATEHVLEAHDELTAQRRVHVRASSPENRAAVEQLEVRLNGLVKDARVHLHRYFRLVDELKKHAAENETPPLLTEMEVEGS